MPNRANIKRKKAEQQRQKIKMPGKKGQFGKATKDFLGGEMLKTGTFRFLPFLVFITLLAFVYIANNYLAENKTREINSLRKELKEIRYEYITTKSELTDMSKQSEIASRLGAKGVIESTEPIKTIKAED